jgi:hypothetical protein
MKKKFAAQYRRSHFITVDGVVRSQRRGGGSNLAACVTRRVGPQLRPVADRHRPGAGRRGQVAW